jgi:hypothetical protein
VSHQMALCRSAWQLKSPAERENMTARLLAVAQTPAQRRFVRSLIAWTLTQS